MRHLLWALSALLVLSAITPTQAASDNKLAEILLAATPSPSDIKKVGGHGGWWREAPEFLGRLDPATGLRTLVMQSYRLPEPGTRERIMMALSAYVSHEAASARFNDMEPEDSGKYGPAQTLTQHPGEQVRLHATTHPRGQTLRVQEGHYILRLTHWTDGLPLTPQQMSQLADVTLERLMELEQEKRPLPAAAPLLHHLPLETKTLGKPMGDAAGPVEWVGFNRAEGENLPDPKLQAFLAKEMSPRIVTLRRWPLLTAPNGQVVDAMLFRLSSVKTALRFMQLDKANRSTELLVDTPLPALPSYLERQSGERGSKMTLVFTKGAAVGVLSCGAPYFYAAGECEPALKELANEIAATLK